MKSQIFHTLFTLLDLTAELGNRPFTTTLLAKQLQTSQQTASRRLIELEREGLIRRVKTPRGETVQLTRGGQETLYEFYLTLKRHLEPSEKLCLEGEVVTGIGEGAYYVGQDSYRLQFKRRLGFIPYPGTLNVRLDNHSKELRRTLRLYKPITLNGFEREGRSFGVVNCFAATLDGIEDVAVVTALRSHYDEGILEVVSPHNLRKKLGLTDGDKVTVMIHPTPE